MMDAPKSSQKLVAVTKECVFQANAHKMAQDALLEQGQQLATVTKERDEWKAEFKAAYKRGTDAEEQLAAAQEELRLCQQDAINLQKDAERYRWLRDTQEGKTVRIMDRREWDFAIDEALAKVGADKGEK